MSAASKAQAAEGLQKAFSLAQDKLAIKHIVSGTVIDVDGYNTCDVELQPGLVMYGVRLNAIEGVTNNLQTIKPKNGSTVLVGIIEGVKTEGVVISCSEIDEVYTKIGTAIVKVRDSKITIEADGINLKTEIKRLSDIVRKIVVIEGRSPDPVQLQIFDTNIDKILE
jgi:hypothetical protein